MTAPAHPYDALLPEVVLGAVETLGFSPDGYLLALNSYENRVYRIGCEDAEPIVAKFYRPERWSDAAIIEEHQFTFELAHAEVPVAAPLLRDGASLHYHRGFRFAVYARFGGRAPDLEREDHAQWIGRVVARVHQLGAQGRFVARGRLDPAQIIDAAARAVRASGLMPEHLLPTWRQSLDAAQAWITARWQALAPVSLRLHGDLHPGNLLWREQGPLLVDFDDAVSGPAIADLWMLMSGDPRQREALLEGYASLRAFDHRELGLIDALALLRQIHYVGWLAQRWSDPAFPRAFPFAADARFWEEHVNDCRAANQRAEHPAQ